MSPRVEQLVDQVKRALQERDNERPWSWDAVFKRLDEGASRVQRRREVERLERRACKAVGLVDDVGSRRARAE